jgi:hypothetical protein
VVIAVVVPGEGSPMRNLHSTDRRGERFMSIADRSVGMSEDAMWMTAIESSDSVDR